MMYRPFAACAMALAVVACSSGPKPPDWQVNAHGAAERAVQAELRGPARVAEAEWRRAVAEVTSTAQPARLARLELLRCAVRHAALDGQACDEHSTRWPSLEPSDAAYRRYLAARPLPSDVELLPSAHRAVARWLLVHPGTPDRSTGAGSITPPPPSVLAAFDDPLSRLVAASVLVRAGHRSAEVLNPAVDTASAQGWRQPLQAWLLLAREQARATGDLTAQQHWEARLRALTGQP